MTEKCLAQGSSRRSRFQGDALQLFRIGTLPDHDIRRLNYAREHLSRRWSGRKIYALEVIRSKKAGTDIRKLLRVPARRNNRLAVKAQLRKN
jgi:hypothetical protein